jgi:hypothetical protein
MKYAKINVPGRVIEFYKGGEAYLAWSRGEGPGHREYDRGEWELFAAVDAGRERSAKGGYWVRADLSDAACEAAVYWADTLAGSSRDSAAWGNQDARNDLRAANNLFDRLRRARKA